MHKNTQTEEMFHTQLPVDSMAIFGGAGLIAGFGVKKIGQSLLLIGAGSAVIINVMERNGYVSMHVCVCVCLYMCMCLNMYVCMYACMYVYTGKCWKRRDYKCDGAERICKHACVCLCMYVCMYVRTYVCMYVW